MWFWHKKKQNFFQVFDISYDKSGYPLFLIYDDGRWQRVSAKHFKPSQDWEEEPV